MKTQQLQLKSKYEKHVLNRSQRIGYRWLRSCTANNTNLVGIQSNWSGKITVSDEFEIDFRTLLVAKI